MSVLKTTSSCIIFLFLALAFGQDLSGQQGEGMTKEQLFEYADNTQLPDEDRVEALHVLTENLELKSDLQMVMNKLKTFSYDDKIGSVLFTMMNNAGNLEFMDLVKEAMDYVLAKGHPELASFGLKHLIKDGNENAYIIEKLKGMDEKNPIVYVDAEYDLHFSALQAATQYGNLDVVKFIAENVQQPEDMKIDKPLHVAAKYGHLSIVQYLVDNFDFQTLFWEDEGKDTPLHNAALGGHVGILTFFGSKGAPNMNPFDSAGFTPLHLAAGQGQLAVVKAYLSNSANPDIKLVTNDVNAGRTLLHLATEGNHTEVVNLVLSYTQNRNPRDNYGVTPLHLAAQLGHLQIFKIISSAVQASDVNPKSLDLEPWMGRNPFHLAAENGQVEILEYMKTLGNIVDPLEQDSIGLTAIHLAAENGQVEVLEFFLNNLDVNYNNPADGTENQRTPLHLAAQNGHLNAVWLLGYYYQNDLWKINDIDAHNYTPLNLAAYNGHLGVVHHLINLGANPDLNGISSKELAYEGGAYNVLEFLLLREKFLPSSNDL